MFTKPTVFILGAGASWHYGYPTGEGLVDEVAEMAGRLREYCQFRFEVRNFDASVPKYIGKLIRLRSDDPFAGERACGRRWQQ